MAKGKGVRHLSYNANCLKKQPCPKLRNSKVYGARPVKNNPKLTNNYELNIVI